MARINKEAAIKNMTGIKGKGAILASGPDNVPAVITDPQGNPQGPAMIKEGEFVFSVESIIGAGNGDYDTGLEKITALHEQLRNMGMQMKQEGSLSNLEGTLVE